MLPPARHTAAVSTSSAPGSPWATLARHAADCIVLTCLAPPVNSERMYRGSAMGLCWSHHTEAVRLGLTVSSLVAENLSCLSLCSRLLRRAGPWHGCAGNV